MILISLIPPYGNPTHQINEFMELILYGIQYNTW